MLAYLYIFVKYLKTLNSGILKLFLWPSWHWRGRGRTPWNGL